MTTQILNTKEYLIQQDFLRSLEEEAEKPEMHVSGKQKSQFWRFKVNKNDYKPSIQIKRAPRKNIVSVESE